MRFLGKLGVSLRGMTALTVGLVVGLLAACGPAPTGSIDFVQNDVVDAGGSSISIDFYRNREFACGLGGNYTFSVINPIENPAGEAPLWVYLHGGGVGYFDESGIYRASLGATEATWNYEESAIGLIGHVASATIDSSGNVRDTTLTRRIEQGYRILVVSMCDHDLYSGEGQAYPNNRTGDTVDGLLATMSAVDHVTNTYSTSQVFVYGTSAGSVGAFALAHRYSELGRPLTGAIADSYVTSERTYRIFDSFVGTFGFPFAPPFEVREAVKKVGAVVDPAEGRDPETAIREGFRATPTLFLGGDTDPFCGGNQPSLPEAAAAGLNNCDWVYDGVRQAIAAQPNTPHQIAVLDETGHVPSLTTGRANDVVDAFLDEVWSSNPPPFGR